MSRINVLVANISKDVAAEVIAESVAARPDMILVEGPSGRCVRAEELDAALGSIAPGGRCALVLVGRPDEITGVAQQWLAKRADLVVLQVDILGDNLRIELRDAGLQALLTSLRELVTRMGTRSSERTARVRLGKLGVSANPEQRAKGPLMQATIQWVYSVLRDAVERVPDENGDANGVSITRATVLQALDAFAEGNPGNPEADVALEQALSAVDAGSEPLATAFFALELDFLEYRLMALGLAPELDLCFQRSIGFLLDDMGRRSGTLGLYCSLLGDAAAIRRELADKGTLTRWRLFEAERVGAADEPLKLDSNLVHWLLGDNEALTRDPLVRRVTRLVPWPGHELLERRQQIDDAVELIEKLRPTPNETHWVLLGGDDAAGWRALLELGARNKKLTLLRVETARLAGVDVLEVEDCACKIRRLTQLTRRPLALDATKTEGSEGEDDRIQRFFAALGKPALPAAVICRDQSRLVRLLGATSFEIAPGPPLPAQAYLDAYRTAAKRVHACLTEEEADSISSRYPLSIDALEHAVRLARGRQNEHDREDQRFIAAVRELAADGVSPLADRIEPLFHLDEIVLPQDRKQQLVEIVDHVRLAPKVLDGWKFRDRLPYGRGVTALFHGPSGTGKTMAAMGISRTLGIQLLRLDLSRVVSKYIGDTEKNLDRVFTDAQRSGSAILIDEADALLGKRSEVKDAHDRYANIEVAYLLQRMEAFEGLAVLTTNMRQNLDPAFLRRLRFIVDFPRPDAESREQIWRQCLPQESHQLDDAAFRQLARRIDLTGGHIRQITVRAAFLAAAANARINLQHIADAARAEFAKLGMPPVELDVKSGRRAA